MANLFPKSTNFLPFKLLVAVGVIGILVVTGVTIFFTPKYTRVGYRPQQPVSFDHSIHATQLGMDCRYCHAFVELGASSTAPATQTCMNCHKQVQANNPKLAPVKKSWDTGEPIKWVRIHQAPDYVYFNHSVHVGRGISCAMCHGQINHMEVVAHDKPHSMGWCLECHRNPEKFIRPQEQVFNLDWKPEQDGLKQSEMGPKLVAHANVQPPQNCAACHR